MIFNGVRIASNGFLMAFTHDPLLLITREIPWLLDLATSSRSIYALLITPDTKASMPSLLCRSQISIGSEFEKYIPTVVHTVRELQL